MKDSVIEVSHNLFCIKVPLPDSPLKYLNAYVVKAPDRNLIIDTGFNSKICYDTMKNGLKSLGGRSKPNRYFYYPFPCGSFQFGPKVEHTNNSYLF